MLCFCLESQTTLVLVATSWEGRKDGTTSSFLIYNNCWLCSSPTETMCPWKPLPKFYSYSCAVRPPSWRCRNGVEHFITERKPHPSQEWAQAEFLIPSGRGSHSRIPFQVWLGRAGASQLFENPQNVPGSCRHHCHKIWMISWRAQSWLMVRNSPYDKSEAKYNWKKEDGGVAIAGRQK